MVTFASGSTSRSGKLTCCDPTVAPDAVVAHAQLERLAGLFLDAADDAIAIGLCDGVAVDAPFMFETLILRHGGGRRERKKGEGGEDEFLHDASPCRLNKTCL